MMYQRSSHESPTEALIGAITRCDCCQECEFDPLYDMVDGDALNAMFESVPSDGCEVDIDAEHCSITIRDGDAVRIYPGGRPAVAETESAREQVSDQLR